MPCSCWKQVEGKESKLLESGFSSGKSLDIAVYLSIMWILFEDELFIFLLAHCFGNPCQLCFAWWVFLSAGCEPFVAGTLDQQKSLCRDVELQNLARSKVVLLCLGLRGPGLFRLLKEQGFLFRFGTRWSYGTKQKWKSDGPLRGNINVAFRCKRKLTLKAPRSLLLFRYYSLDFHLMSYPGKSPVVYQINQGNTLYSERHCPLAVTVKDLNYPYQSHCKDLLSSAPGHINGWPRVLGSVHKQRFQ